MQDPCRRLPHRYVIEEPLFVTFRLHGTLPRGRAFRDARLPSGKAFVAMDRLLDAQTAGPAYLKMPAIAGLVADSIVKGAACDYTLHAWVLMPNHVHLLITPWLDVPTLLRRLKGVSAQDCNKLLGRTGQPFWQAESYDHLVRTAGEFERIRSYILRNPVQAGLAPSAQEYPWSSIARTVGLKPSAD
jgi:putative transposase